MILRAWSERRALSPDPPLPGLTPGSVTTVGGRGLNPSRWLTRILLLIPVLAATTMVWLRRWVSDDGFINYRVIQQLMAGRGPIYNISDRVEVGTSTLWLWLVWLGQAITPGAETGQVMVVEQ